MEQRPISHEQRGEVPLPPAPPVPTFRRSFLPAPFVQEQQQAQLSRSREQPHYYSMQNIPTHWQNPACVRQSLASIPPDRPTSSFGYFEDNRLRNYSRCSSTSNLGLQQSASHSNIYGQGRNMGSRAHIGVKLPPFLKGQRKPASPSCAFCRSNNERVEVYSSHWLRHNGEISCPILRAHQCEFCGATGGQAHTASYCPQNNNRASIKDVLSTPKTSAGKARKKL